MKTTVALMSGVAWIALGTVAFSQSMETEQKSVSVSQVLSTMNANGGTEQFRWEVAPTYSELFGLGVRVTVGGYLSDDFALGAIVDVGEHREEYLANAGFQLNPNMRMIGTVGLLKEREEFVLGEGREEVRQYEYGLSLKGSYDAGMVRGFELNAYHTEAETDSSNAETGDLTGAQAMTALHLGEGSSLRLGAGYERVKWADGNIDEGFTLQALGSQKVSDTMSVNYSAKSAETENVFGLGFAFDLSTPEIQNSALSVDLMRIEGKHGISDDTRVALNWTIGLGAGSSGAGGATVSSMGGLGSIGSTDLLGDVMKRPAFLPERVLVRAKSTETCEYTTEFYSTSWDSEDDYISYIALGPFYAPDYTTLTEIFPRFRTGDVYLDGVPSYTATTLLDGRNESYVVGIKPDSPYIALSSDKTSTKVKVVIRDISGAPVLCAETLIENH